MWCLYTLLETIKSVKRAVSDLRDSLASIIIKLDTYCIEEKCTILVRSLECTEQREAWRPFEG